MAFNHARRMRAGRGVRAVARPVFVAQTLADIATQTNRRVKTLTATPGRKPSNSLGAEAYGRSVGS